MIFLFGLCDAYIFSFRITLVLTKLNLSRKVLLEKLRKSDDGKLG